MFSLTFILQSYSRLNTFQELMRSHCILTLYFPDQFLVMLRLQYKLSKNCVNELAINLLNQFRI